MHGKNTMSNQWQERVSYANPRRGWGVGEGGILPLLSSTKYKKWIFVISTILRWHLVLYRIYSLNVPQNVSYLTCNGNGEGYTGRGENTLRPPPLARVPASMIPGADVSRSFIQSCSRLRALTLSHHFTHGKGQASSHKKQAGPKINKIKETDKPIHTNIQRKVIFTKKKCSPNLL